MGDAELLNQLFCGLVEWSEEMNLVPSAASHWEVLDGGRRYIFYLRQDLRWSDGEPVTARDFEFAWKRALDPVTQSPAAVLLYDLRGAREFHQRLADNRDRVGVAALDPYTLLVDLEEPAGYFPYILACPIAFALPEHVIRREGMAWAEPGRIVTNGPFQIEAWEGNKPVRFSRSPLYPGRFNGNIERVELVYCQDVTAFHRYFAAGQADEIRVGTNILSDSELDQYRETGQLITHPEPAEFSLHFITDQPPFDDPRLRRAFVMAIDRVWLAEKAFKGYALPATGGLVPPGIPGHSPHIGLPYDAQQAQSLLAEAGFPGGNSFPEVILQLGIEPETHRVLPYLLATWERTLGVTIHTQAPEVGARGGHRKEGKDYHFFFAGWLADYPDPDTFLRTNILLRHSRWQNANFAALIEAGRHSLDQASRLELYRQADLLLTQEAIVAPLFYGQVYELRKPWVRKHRSSSNYTSVWKDIILDPS